MVNVSVSPEEVWGFFKDNPDSFALPNSSVPIANNYDYGIEICISKEQSSGMPRVCVSEDNEIVFEETLYDEEYCAKEMVDIYNEYLSDEHLVQTRIGLSSDIDDEDGFDMDENTQQAAIDEREAELGIAFEELLDLLTWGSDGFFEAQYEGVDDITKSCLDLVCKHLKKEFGISVYRPMILKDYETKEDFYEEYPYDCMDL
ncbi:MAG: hypothetical protein KBS82_05450 [Oscillospiraceae bacterium]|nr:hypothetical protein [Candidatus Limimonas egerieequi]